MMLLRFLPKSSIVLKVSTSDPKDTNEGELTCYLSRVEQLFDEPREGSTAKDHGRHISAATSWPV